MRDFLGSFCSLLVNVIRVLGSCKSRDKMNNMIVKRSSWERKKVKQKKKLLANEKKIQKMRE